MSQDSKIHFVGLVVVCCLLAGCGDIIDGDSTGPQPGVPLLGVSDDTLDFGLAGLQRELIIYNTGGGTLEWIFLSYPAWIDPSSAEGTLQASASEIVVLGLDRDLLNSGENQGIVHLSSNDGELLLTVLADQSDEPVLGELPEFLDFGDLETSLEVIIHNTGGDTLEWNISIEDTFITVSPESGMTADQTTVSVNIDRENAPEGEIQSLLTVDSNGGSGEITILAFNAPQEGGWLSYCYQVDSYYNAMPEDYYFIVLFYRPEDWGSFRIKRIRAAFHTYITAWDVIQIACWGAIYDQGWLWPDLNDIRYSTPTLNPVPGWNEWTVDWPLNMDAFCVGYLQIDAYPDINPDPYFYSTYPAGHSFLAWQWSPTMLQVDPIWQWEWCLEVYVEPEYPSSGSNPSSGRWLKPEAIPRGEAFFGENIEPSLQIPITESLLRRPDTR